MIEPVYMKPHQRKRKMNSTVSYINEWQDSYTIRNPLFEKIW